GGDGGVGGLSRSREALQVVPRGWARSSPGGGPEAGVRVREAGDEVEGGVGQRGRCRGVPGFLGRSSIYHRGVVVLAVGGGAGEC
ncbi:unnamed protein product, partial [Ectocarpus sp. 12 AP-2014]